MRGQLWERSHNFPLHCLGWDFFLVVIGIIFAVLAAKESL